MKQLVVCAALLVATTSAAVAGNGTNLTKHVADTTQAVIVLDVAAARNAKLVKDSFTKLLETQPDAKAKFDELGIDPLRDIDTLMFSFGGFAEIENIKDNGSMVIIVEGKIPKSVFNKMTASVKTRKDGVDIYTKDDTEAAMIGNRLYFTKTGRMADQIALAKGKSKANVASSAAGKDLRDAIKKASTKMHMWGAIVLPKADREKTVAAQLPVDAVSFGVQFSSDLEAYLRLETPSATSAETSIKTLNTALPQVKMMMSGIGLDVAAGTISLAQDKSAINGSLKVSQTEMKTLFAMMVAQKKSAAPAGPPPPAPGTTRDPLRPPTPTPPPTGGLGGKTK